MIMLLGLTDVTAKKTEIFLQGTKGVKFELSSNEEGLFDIHINPDQDSPLLVNIHGGEGEIFLNRIDTEPESLTRITPFVALHNGEYFKMEVI